MLTNLKNFIPGQNEEKPPAANPAPQGQTQATEEPEQNPAEAVAAKDAAENENAEPLDDADIEKMLFDEYLGAAEYTFDEFVELVNQPPEEKGETEDEKRHWSHPRRWKVVLWNLSIKNYMTDKLSLFVEFEFGGSREECKVHKGDASKIYAKGEDKNYLRTCVVKDVGSAEPVDMQFRRSFEYRGSYLDLEREKLKIKVWEYRTWTLNHLEAVFEEPLLTFATGETHVERDLYKFVKGRRSRRCRIAFHLYFQELYDFELSFLKWKAFGLSSSVSLQRRVFYRTESPSAVTRDSAKNRKFLERAQYRLQQRKFKKGRKAIRNDTTLQQLSMAASNRLGGSLKTERRAAISTTRTMRSTASKVSVPASLCNLTSIATGEAPSSALSPLDELVLCHIQTLVIADQDEDAEEALVTPPKKEGSTLSTQDRLPTVRLRISLLHSSSLNSGVRVISPEQVATSPSWDNLGEVYFRGTLRDLDSTYLEVTVEDISGSKAFRQIGYGQLPLRGVIGYPSLQMELGAPNWVSLQAKVEGWGETLNDWTFGFLEGHVMIAHTPRYRQLGEVYEVDASRVYLIVKIVGVDQIVTADNRSAVDTYVEVSFDGTTRRTRVVRNSLNPTWDDCVAVPLRFRSVNDISYSDIQKKGKVYLDVWGIGTNYVDHLGGCTFHLYDIFFNEKGQKKPLVPKERIILETNIKSNYDTRVLVASKRLSFIHKDDRPSTLSFEAWTCPDILDASGLQKMPAPERFDTKNNMPRALAETYDQLKTIFMDVIQTKGLLDDEEIGPPRFFDVEHLDQRKEAQFLPTLLTPIKPPVGVDSHSGIFHYIRCVPFVIKRQALTFPPDFTMQLRAGNALDHTLLMCSLLLGLPSTAYVCIGSLWDLHMHAWVATFHWDHEKEMGLVKFWETTTGIVYVLKNRFKDPEFAHSLLKDPEMGQSEISRKHRRYRLGLLGTEFDGISSKEGNEGFGERIADLVFERASSELIEKIAQDLTAFRAARNLATKWNRDEVLEAFLQTGLELLHQVNTAREEDYQLAKLKLEDWRKALYSRVPNSFRVRGAPLHYNTLDAKAISDSMIRQVEFLESRDKSASFAIAASMYSLPGELSSVYIYVLLSQKVTERERRRILAAKEQEAREQAQRRARVKRTQFGRRDGPGRNIGEKDAKDVEQASASPESTPEEVSSDKNPALIDLDLDSKESVNNDEVSGETKKKKHKKAGKTSRRVPKVKKRSPRLVEGSEVAYIEIERNYYEEDNAPNFKGLMDDLETAISEALGISRVRVRGFQARYADKQLVFAIHPVSPESSGDANVEPPNKLMVILEDMIPEMTKEPGVFSTITGGRANLVWGGPGSYPYCDDGAGHDAPAEEHASEMEVPEDLVPSQGNATVGGVVAAAEDPDVVTKKPKKKTKKKSERNKIRSEDEDVNSRNLDADGLADPLVAPVAAAAVVAETGIGTAATATAAAVSQKPERKHKKSGNKGKKEAAAVDTHEEVGEGEEEELHEAGTRPLSIAGATAALRGVLRFKARGVSIPSSGVSESSSSSESDLTELEEKAMHELAALRKERDRLLAAVRQQDSVGDGDRSTETGRAQIRYVEGDESDEGSGLDSLYSDGSDAAAVARQKLLEQQLQRLQEQQQRLDALKAQLRDTETQLAEAERLGGGFPSPCVDIPAPPPLFSATQVVGTPQQLWELEEIPDRSSHCQKTVNLNLGGAHRATLFGESLYKVASPERSSSNAPSTAVVKSVARVGRRVLWESPFMRQWPHIEPISDGSCPKKDACDRGKGKGCLRTYGVAEDSPNTDLYRSGQETVGQERCNNHLLREIECPLLSLAASSKLLQRQHHDIRMKRHLRKQQNRSALKRDRFCGRRDPNIPYCRIRRCETSEFQCPEDLFKGFLP